MAPPVRYPILQLLICGLLLTLGAPAHAQSAADKAAAEALFDRGLALMRDGKYQEACERLEQSQSIDPGIGTMLYLAECYEKTGKTASAWALFREASSLAQAAGQSERAEAGKRRAAALEKGLSRLTLQVPANSKVPGLEIQDNGRPVHPSVWGYAVPVDPGSHHIEAKAPGHLTWSKDLNVGDHGASSELTIPTLERDMNAPVAIAPSPQEAAQSASDQPSSAPAEHQGRMSTQHIVGLALGGAGVVAAVAGGIAGIYAITKNNDAKDKGCDGASCPTSAGRTASDKALSAARASTGLWVVGGVLVASGLVTFFLAPKYRRADVALRVDRQTAALQVGGVF
jgi:hypothetical protein